MWETREWEIKEFMYFYNHLSNTHNPEFSLINGDFNEVPEAQFIIDLQNEFKCAYKEVLGDHPEITTLKYWESGLVYRCIDYIFYKGPLKIIDVLSIPSKEEVMDTGLPRANYPSDHYMLHALFEF